MSTAAIMQPFAEPTPMKRILAAALFGLAMGGFCATGAFYAGILEFAPITLAWILLNRTVMGVAIGMSGLRLHWAWNGVVIGLVVGSVFSFYLFMNVPEPLPAINAIVNGLYGLIIEFFTTVVCKLPPLGAPRSLRAA